MKRQISQAEKIIAEQVLQKEGTTLGRKILETPTIILPAPGHDPEMVFRKQLKTRRFILNKNKDELDLKNDSREEKINKARYIKSNENKYTNEKIDNYIIDGVNHDKYLTSENRKPEKKDKIVSEFERQIKDYRDAGENRLDDQQNYLEKIKKINKEYFDPNNITNGELRGHVSNGLNQVNEYMSIENGGISAIDIISEVEIKNVSYHSRLNQENSDSQKNATELLIAAQYAKLTGKQVYVTADQPLDDPEIKKHLEEKNFQEPKNASQSTLDFLVTSVDSQGRKKTESADGKLRSLNTALSKEPVSRPFETDTTEVWSVGSADEETQKKIHKAICKNAKEVCDKQKPSKDLDEKRAEIEKYDITGNPKYLDKAKFVVVVVFNNDSNFNENQECYNIL